MSKWFLMNNLRKGIVVQIAGVVLLLGQQAAHGQSQQDSPAAGRPSTPDQAKPGSPVKPETHITPEEAKQLFGLVDELIKFSSQETGLPIKSQVKRQLTTRTAVEKYLKEKFEDDEDSKRMQRSEIVLKKFGLLDRDFDLKPFLLELLKEQIAAYYDPKEKTVNLLDWVSVDDQKSVLAHELTHALQDQHVNLDKWSDQTPPDVSHTAAEDRQHLAKDEIDTARDAVTEGQATAVMMDNILKPMGKSLVGDPEVVEIIKQKMNGSEDSPVLARAPLLLSESLLFPYREGLSFEQDVWMDRGQGAAFTGALDRPPSSTWEIMNPREYERGRAPSVPYLPDIHPLLDSAYRPYDIGQVGELDVQILANLFGGEKAARNLTPAWDGGVYWAGQKLSATPAEQATTKSITFFYLSAWKNESSAQSFADLYAEELGRKYSGVKRDAAAEKDAEAPADVTEKVWTTDEGPAVITQKGKLVFVAESFDLPVARKLATLILESQANGPLQNASVEPSVGFRPVDDDGSRPGSLSGPLVRFMSNCGVAKAVVDGARQSTRRMTH
ncbi:hypothetical protein [Occallatibacter savannae]|uniref:hypothetical protein n=1 Tax=Occallatibacter savannae TaxID=1002691 RepID=UPI000D6967CC|nr:hypothetical protein [Occallatibacter savannae]